MGWKSGEYVYTGGSLADQHERCSAIVSGCAAVLLSMGWELDTSKNETLVDVNVVNSGTTNECDWLCLKSVTGAKLVIFLTYSKRVLPKLQQISHEGVDNYDSMVRDVGISIIPPGSESTFGDNPAAVSPKFIPDDATHLVGHTSYSNDSASCAKNNSSGTNYRYFFISDGETVVMFTPLGYSFVAGKILCAVADEVADILPQAKYGSFGLCGSSSNINSTQNHTITTRDGYSILNQKDPDSTSGQTALMVQSHSSTCFMQNGDRFIFPTGSYVSNVGCSTDLGPVSNFSTSSYRNGLRRWSALSCIIFNTEPSTGQTNYMGDGYKGVYDTNLMRYVGTQSLSRGDILSDGKFIYVGGGLALGWDSGNTVLPPF